MKQKLTLAILSFAVMPGVILCQTTNAPLNHAEILGRLAAGASRSYIAHLVKTRGVNFSSDAHYLSLISRAGGNGILFQRLSEANARTSNGSPFNDDPPFEHLARCAELLQLGSVSEAETVCRAAIDENPASPWPLLATLRAIQQEEVKPSDTPELARRAVALAPNLPEARNDLAVTLQPGPELLAELQRASALDSERGNLDPLSTAESDGSFSLGFVFRPNESPDSAIQSLLTIESDFAPTHVLAASFYQSRGQQDRALVEMRKALRLEPDNAQLHSSLSDFYRNAGDVESQIAALREAVRAEPNGRPHRLALARTFEELGRLPEAVSEFKSLLALYPTDSMASVMLVDIYLGQEYRPLAIEELRRFLKATSVGVDNSTHMEQTWAEAYRLAEVLYYDGQFDAAAAQYLEMLRYRPQDAGVHNDYGIVLSKQNKLNESVEQYRQALQYQPEMSVAHKNLGMSLMHKLDFEGAIAEYRAALDLNPEEPTAHALLGITLGRKGNFEEAIAEFKQFIAKNPEHAFAHANLGHALVLKNDPASAVPELRRALELNPDIRSAENELAWIYATAPDPKLRDPQAALSHAQHAVNLLQVPPVPSSEESAAYLDTLAEALLLNGQAGEALRTEDRAVSADQKNPELQRRLERFRKAALVPGPKPR